jgi:arabinose-5-phosphate isomerase
MGKAGHIARKLAATFSSTGTPSIFLHPAEAYHGDLGIVTRDDLAIIISNSGETEEVVRLLPCFKRFQVPILALTGNIESTVAKSSDVALDTGVIREACPLNCAPTSSTTTALAMGDALACALVKAKGFREEDFAAFHPGGSLGAKLLLRVSDLMLPFAQTPSIPFGGSFRDALLSITEGQIGAVFIVDGNGGLEGILTDGDVRRLLQKGNIDLNRKIMDVATKAPLVVSSKEMAATALGIMEANQISSLPVIDTDGHLQGALQIHMLLQAGIS